MSERGTRHEGDEEYAKLGNAGELLGVFDCINEVATAIAAASSLLSGMSEKSRRVETTSRLAQWKIDALSSYSYCKSDPFKIGLWNWYLAVERNKQLLVKLFPQISSLTKEKPPIASFIIKLVSSAAPERRTIIHPEICDKPIKNSDEFVWAIDTLFTGRFVIDVEFLDLKIVPESGGDPLSIWTGHHVEKNLFTSAHSSLSRMLSDDIHTDITINADGGSIRAHRAVLASRSPVFRSMFAHDLVEKELSTVDMPDMNFEVCRAFLRYVYGDFEGEEFLRHRLALLRAADKYDVSDLKETCHGSLLEDIDAGNVLERLQAAHLYGLSELKSGCMRYLVRFGKVYEIRDDFNLFLQTADRQLIADVFQEVLAAWKGF